jgi:hypothetical protein
MTLSYRHQSFLTSWHYFLQEWWGIDFEIKKQAKIVADHGFRVLVPE